MPQVVPALRTCHHGTHQYPALVFAQYGAPVLFAAEYARRYGVGLQDAGGRVVEADQYATLAAAPLVIWPP